MAQILNSQAPSATGDQRGFILPLTLWIIAAIGLVIVAVNQWVSQAVDNARVLSEQSQMSLAVADIQNELIYAMGTRPLTYRGLEVGKLINEIDRSDATALMTADYQTSRFIHMDGRPYSVESWPQYTLQIFDGRGLVNLNAVSAPIVRRLLGLFEVPEPDQNSLVDALEDYTDRDDLTRISGAERREYERLGRREPANAWLMTPMEAQYVLGWDKLPQLWQRELQSPLLTTCAANGFNPNSASREAILATLPGLLEENIQAVLDRREERPFRNMRELAATANSLMRDEPFFYIFAPGQCIIVEITRKDTGDRERFSLTIDNFNAKTKPWRIDYAFPIPAKTEPLDRKLLAEEVFPTPDTLDAFDRPGSEASSTGTSNALGAQSPNESSSDF
jgi:general secretion pathway protein K